MGKASTPTVETKPDIAPEPAARKRAPRRADPDPVALFAAVGKANDRTIALAVDAMQEFKRCGAHFPEMGVALNRLQSAAASLARVFDPQGVVGAIPELEDE